MAASRACAPFSIDTMNENGFIRAGVYSTGRLKISDYLLQMFNSIDSIISMGINGCISCRCTVTMVHSIGVVKINCGVLCSKCFIQLAL